MFTSIVWPQCLNFYTYFILNSSLEFLEGYKDLVFNFQKLYPSLMAHVICEGDEVSNPS